MKNYFKLFIPLFVCILILILIYLRRFFKIFSSVDLNHYLDEEWAIYQKCFILFLGILVFSISYRNTYYPNRDTFIKRLLKENDIRKGLLKILKVYEYFFIEPLKSIDDFLDKYPRVVKVKMFFVMLYRSALKIFFCLDNFYNKKITLSQLLKLKDFTLKNFLAFVYILSPLGLFLVFYVNYFFYNVILVKVMLIGFTLITINFKFTRYWKKKYIEKSSQEIHYVFEDFEQSSKQLKSLQEDRDMLIEHINLFVERNEIYEFLRLKINSYVRKLSLNKNKILFLPEEENLKTALVSFFEGIIQGEKVIKTDFLIKALGVDPEDYLKDLSTFTKENLLRFSYQKMVHIKNLQIKVKQEIKKSRDGLRILEGKISKLNKECKRKSMGLTKLKEKKEDV